MLCFSRDDKSFHSLTLHGTQLKLFNLVVHCAVKQKSERTRTEGAAQGGSSSCSGGDALHFSVCALTDGTLDTAEGENSVEEGQGHNSVEKILPDKV
jgi:hypothetical protein